MRDIQEMFYECLWAQNLMILMAGETSCGYILYTLLTAIRIKWCPGCWMDGSGINMNQVSQVLWLTLKTYTLWQTNIANWKITIFSRSINYFSGPCSIAMLNYQRVMIWTSAKIWVPVRRVIRNKCSTFKTELKPSTSFGSLQKSAHFW